MKRVATDCTDLHGFLYIILFYPCKSVHIRGRF